MFAEHLQASLGRLDQSVKRWLRRALDSGWYPLGAGSYDGGPGGALCPIAAAATMAGIWFDGGVREGNPEWGSPDAPSPAVEDFAAYFDLCSEANGLEYAIALVRNELRRQDEELMAA